MDKCKVCGGDAPWSLTPETLCGYCWIWWVTAKLPAKAEFVVRLINPMSS